MKNLTEIPNAYQAIWSLDLQRNQKKALWLNLATLLVFAGMVVVAAFVVPLSFLLDLSCFFRADGITGTLAALWTSLGKLAVVVVGAVACLMLQALLGGLLGFQCAYRISFKAPMHSTCCQPCKLRHIMGCYSQ